MKRFMTKVGRIARAPRSDRRAIARALAMEPRVARRLRRDGYSTTMAWLESQPRPEMDSNRINQAVWRSDLAMRALPWRVRCLERSMVGWWLGGPGATVHLGVTTDGEPHRFHAWVERDGRVLNDLPDVGNEYVPLTGRTAETADPRSFD